MKPFFILFSIIFLSFTYHHAYSQTDTAFWFVAPEVAQNGSEGLDRPISLHIATFSQQSTVTISQPASPTFTPIVVNLTANSSATVDLTTYIDSIENKPANTILHHGIYIKATNKITVYYEVLGGFNTCGNCNPEAFSLKGHNALGTSFYTPFQQTYDNSNSYSPTPLSAFDIVSSQDNTQVTITPTQNIVGHTAGTPFTITLNKGQTFSCTATSESAANHPSGSTVTSNKPIAVTVKDDLIAILGQDLEGDQLIPTSVTGSEYIVVKAPSSTNDLAVIVGTQNGTQISVNGTVVSTIGAGQTYQYALNSNASGADYITSNLPIYVFQLTTSDGEAGGAILPPLECTGSTDVCVTRASSQPYNAFIITQNGNQGDFLCNGSSTVITSGAFTAVPGTSGNWVYAVINLSSVITQGSPCRVTNSSGLFSLGILEGISGGSNYAYFSNFVTQNNTVNPISICSPGSATLQPSVTGTHLWSTGSVADSITVTQSGTYWVQNSLSGCLITDTFKVTTTSLPVISVSPPTSAICLGKSISIFASGAQTYQWSPSMELSTTSGASVIATPTTTTTYTITGSNGNGCSSSINYIVTVNPLPVITVIPPSTSLCNGQSVSLSANGTTSYQWSPATGLAVTTGSSILANPTLSTTYTIIGTSSLGCSDTVNAVIKVDLPIQFNVTPATPTICLGQSVKLSVSGTYSYQWSPSVSLSSTSGTSITASPITTTTYTIAATDLAGCTQILLVTVNVNPVPVVTVSSLLTTICGGKSTNLSAGGATTYQWSPSTGLSATSGSSVIATPIINSTYDVIGTSLGCSDTTNVTIRVIQDSLNVSINNASVCQGNSVTIISTGADNYVWSPASGLNTTLGDTVIANPTITTSYTLTATGTGGCPDTENIVVNVNLPPVLYIIPSNPQICFGQSIALNVSGALNYSWSPSTGLNQTNGSTVTANPTTMTTYIAYGTDALGCNDSTKTVLKVNPLPVVNAITSMDTICHGLSVTLTASGASTYQWNPTTGLSSSINSTVQADPTITTTYSVYGTSTLGCVDTAMVTVNIISNSIIITLNPTNSIICQGNSANISASGGINYGWSPSIGLNTTTGSSVIATPVINTTYSVIGVGNGNCADTAKAPIIVSSPPTIIIHPLSPEVCDGQTLLLTASGALQYVWSPSTGLYETSGASVNAHPNDTTAYTVIGTDALGCIDSAKFTLNVDMPPTSTFNISVLSICDPLQIQFSNTTIGGTSYRWYFSDGDSSVAQNPTHTFAKPGVYKIILISTSKNGCSDTAITFDSLANYTADIFIPNSFTPSVVGVNQIFRPNVECADATNYIFRVYDRWGMMLYETNEPSNGWDGTYKGKEEPLNVYVYYVEMTCGTCSFFKKGDVTLIR